MTQPTNILKFLHLVSNLKTTKRTGWIRHDVEAPESIADHMYRMGIMSLLLKDLPHINYSKCMRMALVHDLAEAIVGDISPQCGISKTEKSKREEAAIHDMVVLLEGSEAAQEMQQLWSEYESGSSEEAKIVKDIDKLEMAIQAYEYEKRDGKDLQAFFDSTKDIFRHPWVQSIYKVLSIERSSFGL